jgi:HPt (histidine-containing phosphotransfer) domain-containing protein
MSDDQKNPRDPIPSELVQGDEFFDERMQEFVSGLQRRMAEISRAVDAQDYVALSTLAVRLRGSACGVGYTAFTEQAARLERHALDAEIEAVKRDLRALENMVARVVLRT